MSRLLAAAGYEVETCGSGVEAVTRVIRQPGLYDAVLIDIYMPEMDGLETIRGLRDGGYGGVIFAVSGRGFDSGLDVIRLASLLGADAGAPKPLAPSVPATLSQLIQRRTAA